MAGTKVIDADGHIIERTDELRKYLKSPFNKRGGPLTASEPWDRDLQQTLPPEPVPFPERPPRRNGCDSWTITASSRHFCIRRRSAMSRASVNRSMRRRFAKAYNDYVHDRYAKISNRLRPVAILPFQDPESAVVELRRSVRDLGCRGAVVRTTGLRLPLGHKFYDPIYREAESLGCASRCMAPTAPKNWPRGRSRPSPKSIRYLFRWECLSSFPT